MVQRLKKILYLLGILFLIVFLLIVANQLISLYHNLSTVHPIVGIVGVSIMSLLMLILLVTPFILIAKFQEPMPFPENDKDLEKYKTAFKEKLAKHPTIIASKLDPNNSEQLLEIDLMLKEKADKIIFESASAVFVSTAISQNGKLDAFTVLVAQIRIIWRVAHVYWQRPSIRNLRQLYTNVAFNAMAASTIEQMDLSQQIQPVVNAVLKSPGKHIPIVGHAAHMITDAILEGTVNAFLTLRIGVLTKNYCFPEVNTINEIKSNSFLEASFLLKRLVLKSSSKIVEGVLKAGKNASVQTFKSSYDALGKAVKKTKTGILGIFSSQAEDTEKETT